MTYRDDAQALAARQATLEAELFRKQRELAEVTSMLAEARRVEQAESYFERAPDLRRRQRHHLAIAAVLALLITGGAGFAAVAAAGHRAEEVSSAVGEPRPAKARPRPARVSPEYLERMKAQDEAFRALGLIPVVPPIAPSDREAEILCRLPPVRSPAGEDQR
jgi:hypothetical protein